MLFFEDSFNIWDDLLRGFTLYGSLFVVILDCFFIFILCVGKCLGIWNRGGYNNTKLSKDQLKAINRFESKAQDCDTKRWRFVRDNIPYLCSLYGFIRCIKNWCINGDGRKSWESGVYALADAMSIITTFLAGYFFPIKGTQLLDVWWFLFWGPLFSSTSKYLIIGIGELIILAKFKKENCSKLGFNTYEGIIFHLIIKKMFFFFAPLIYVILRIVIYLLKLRRNEMLETIRIMNMNCVGTTIGFLYCLIFYFIILNVSSKFIVSLGKIEKLLITVIAIPILLALADASFSKLQSCCYKKVINQNNRCHGVQNLGDLTAFEYYNLKNHQETISNSSPGYLYSSFHMQSFNQSRHNFHY